MTNPPQADDWRSMEPAPDVDELIERAAALRPMLFDRAAQTERDQCVSREVTAELVRAGLYRICQPRRFGGYGLPPSVMLQVGFELGRACGSTAWCVMIGNVNAWMTSYWPIEAQQEIWAESSDDLVIGTFVPTGNCSPAPGGYHVSGRWPFGSNCDHAAWMFVGAALPDADGKPADVGWFMIPRAELGIDHDSWRVSGMQGTGSKTLFANDPLFVPDHRIIRFSDVMRGTTPGPKEAGLDMSMFAFTTFGALGLVAPLLGMAQGALDWFSDTMQKKVKTSLKPGGAGTAAQSPFTQTRIGEASAAIDSALCLLLADLAPVEKKVMEGQPLTVTERIRIRRDIGFAAAQSVRAVNLLFEGAGASAASLDAPIQRYWRDINAAARHATLDVQTIYSLVGQDRLGVPTTSPF
ncbi:acyl-CoA dehydrogenase family protein [Sphingobium phenoxybenzoativorans]|uniref:Acyl-CoA dehydrogenase family protein n=1 Tax=Sphingobium phenoxybenzoativorans TaxID=1592790 RepID=A0A975K594_9SPHN|nr:acyl-CoA dehydrogenase family protein [Sphingobium phenoxybenzoativorans]QUT04624.1 acyl-CoA dehydrogenase family protein [Sphingobium phenoxybenzoativorans]